MYVFVRNVYVRQYITYNRIYLRNKLKFNSKKVFLLFCLSISISFWFCICLPCNPREVQCIRKSSLNGESHAIVLLHSFISANCLKRSFATLILLRLKEGELGVNQEFKQTVTNDLVFFHCISNLCGSTELRNLTDNMPEKS